MSRTLNAAAIAAAALTAGLTPGLANAATPAAPATTSSNAPSQLVQRIAAKSPQVAIHYALEGYDLSVLRANTDTLSGDAYSINKIPTDAAQTPAKLEWVMGIDTQIVGDTYLRMGIRHRMARDHGKGNDFVDKALAAYSLANFYIGQADTELGIKHPTLSARPLTSQFPAPATTTPDLTTLTGAIQAGTAMIEETLPARIPSAQYDILRPNKVACHAFEVLIDDLHVKPALKSAQQEWVAGVRTQQLADQQLAIGGNDNAGDRSTTTGDRAIDTGLAMLRKANTEISQADATLGIHPTRPSAELPAKVVYS